MKRFRFTLLALCLLLLFLGISDLRLWLNNPEPLTIGLAELQRTGPPREWLTVTGGVLDLPEAISTSGSIELDAFLVPLKTSVDAPNFRVLVETRRPEVLQTLSHYYFQLDSKAEQQRYLAEHPELFYLHQTVTGMLAGGLVASGNRDKLLKLAKDLGMQVPKDVIFLTEAKEPPRWRGIFFLAAGLLGLLKVLTLWRQKPTDPALPSTNN